MSKSVKGNIAEQVLAAGEGLGLVKTPDPGILAEGVAFVVEAFEREELINTLEDLTLDADMHDTYLVDVATIEKTFSFSYAREEKEQREQMRNALRESLQLENQLTAGLYQQFTRLENKLRQKHIVHGVEVDAAPANLPLVIAIKAKRAQIRQIEEEALDFMLAKRVEAETACPDAVSYYEEFQALWESYKNPKGEENDG